MSDMQGIRCPAMTTGELGDYRCVRDTGHDGNHAWNYPPAPREDVVAEIKNRQTS